MLQERRTERYGTLYNDHFSADYINMAPSLRKNKHSKTEKKNKH